MQPNRPKRIHFSRAYSCGIQLRALNVPNIRTLVRLINFPNNEVSASRALLNPLVNIGNLRSYLLIALLIRQGPKANTYQVTDYYIDASRSLLSLSLEGNDA